MLSAQSQDQFIALWWQGPAAEDDLEDEEMEFSDDEKVPVHVVCLSYDSCVCMPSIQARRLAACNFIVTMILARL